MLRRHVSFFSLSPGFTGKEMSWRCCGPDSGKSILVFALYGTGFFIFDIFSLLIALGLAFFPVSLVSSVLASYLWTGIQSKSPRGLSFAIRIISTPESVLRNNCSSIGFCTYVIAKTQKQWRVTCSSWRAISERLPHGDPMPLENRMCCVSFPG